MGTRRVDQPTPAALLGDYEEAAAVPVCIESPVLEQTLPCPDASLYSRIVGLNAEHLVKQDLRRNWITIISRDDDIYLARTEPECTKHTGAFWPKGVPLVLHGSYDIWCIPNSVVSRVSVISEQGWD